MENTLIPRVDQTRLDRTLKVLQDRVKEQKAVLEEVSLQTAPFYSYLKVP